VSSLLRRPFRFAIAVLAMLAATVPPPPAAATRSFADRVRALSETPGYFDTDNLISNEASYLHVVPELVESGLSGGAYIGVGPDQNFSYIAQLRPSVAYLVDIRRDNLLLHLLLKALFDMAPTRIEYLSLLTGRAPPPKRLRETDLALPDVIGWIDRAPLTDRAALQAAVEKRLRGYAVPLSRDDALTMARFHDEFIDQGLDLQFRSHGRAPNSYYPTLRRLLMATDRLGQRWSYLETEAAYTFIRSLHARDAIVPVVGDLSGAKAMRAIGAELQADGLTLSAIYVSNVEDYLFRGRRFGAFIENLRAIPRAHGALIIRSIFRGGPSASEVQPVDDVLAGASGGRYGSYGDLIFRPRR